jgi:hypothetical protein
MRDIYCDVNDDAFHGIIWPNEPPGPALALARLGTARPDMAN